MVINRLFPEPLAPPKTTKSFLWIAFAPYDQPEIAVSVVIEGGSAGAIGAQIAREVFDYWLAAKADDNSVDTENSLLK